MKYARSTTLIRQLNHGSSINHPWIKHGLSMTQPWKCIFLYLASLQARLKDSARTVQP
ncbi:hypothetical protein LCGC14_1343780 [marine sediment metagenome]|uniref:Uncharacterized protein n=1 Tax=marine sediment metagenome TaxID=412755 RepID=A0A0F9KDL9_9ZZZZ